MTWFPRRVAFAATLIAWCGCVAAGVTTAVTVTPAPVPSSGAVAPEAVPDANVVALEGLSRRVEAVGARMDAMSRQIAVGARDSSAKAAAASASQERAVWIVSFLLLCLATGAFLAFLVARSVRRRAEANLTDLATLPLHKLIMLTRDTNAALLQRLQLHGHQNTDVFMTVQRSLPALERESGRSIVRVKDYSKDVALVDDTRELTPKSVVLGRGDARTIHQHALEGALAQARETTRLAA